MKSKAVVGCSNFVLQQEVAAVVVESNGDGVGYYCVVTTLPTSQYVGDLFFLSLQTTFHYICWSQLVSWSPQRTIGRKSTKCRALSGRYLQILWEKDYWSAVIYMPLSHYLLYLKYLKFSPTFKFHKNWIQEVTIGVSNWVVYLYHIY